MINRRSGYIGLVPRFLTPLVALVLLATQSFSQAEYPTVFPQPVLILDQDTFFQESKLGQAISIIGAERRTLLLNESRKISDSFEIEELKLTEMRAETSAEDFRILSEDFDERVQEARENQLAKDVELQQYVDGQLRRFLVIAAPYLSDIMFKYRASAIVDQRTVLLFDRNMDITDEAIKALDQAFAQNPDMANPEE